MNGEAIVVKRIYEEYSQGISIPEIIKNLQVNHIPSPNNNMNYGEIRYQWREETIRRMLSNKVYLGHVEYGKRIHLSYKSKKIKYLPPEEWKIVYNRHEAIVAQELFDKVQKQREKNKMIKKKKHEWKLNGLVKCKECGSKMTLKVEYKNGKLKNKKLYCLKGIKKYEGKECIRKSKGFDEEILNQIIAKELQKVINKIDIEKLKAETIKQQSRNSEIENRKHRICYELAKIKKEMRTLYLDYKEGLLDKNDYKNFYQEKEIQKNQLENKMEFLIEENRQFNRRKEDSNQMLLDIIDTRTWKSNLIAEMIDNIQIDKENQIYMEYRYNIF
jgi:site-specific DNA recombinase